MGDNFIYFAFSDNENETNLVFQSPKKDADNINVAFVSIDAYNTYFSDDNKSYMFIGNDISNLTKVEVDLSESINGSDGRSAQHLAESYYYTHSKTGINENSSDR